MATAIIDGISTRYEVIGDGPPLLMYSPGGFNAVIIRVRLTDGRLFAGVRGGDLPTITYRRAWIRARKLALTPAEQASPLARRPYDLRHACLSTWLNGGVYPTQVAEWAGHNVDVLPRIYAKCIAGQDELAKRRIDEALRQSHTVTASKIAEH